MRGEEDCIYLGYLENEVEACVAMTGCVGLEDVEFTILSERAKTSSLYRWTKEGHVLLIDSTVLVKNLIYTFTKH